MSKMTLFIHTYGRVDNQITYAQFPKSLKERTFFVVQAREAKQWVKHDNVIELPPNIQKLSPTRQWILEYAALENMKYICMMDDDLKFQRRIEKEGGGFELRTMEDWGIEHIFNLLELQLKEGYLHAGIGHREYSNGVKGFERICCAMLRVLAYQPKKVLELGCRFDRVGVRQDLDMTLQLVTHGYPNFVTYEYTQSHQKNNAGGGCSTYRTDEYVAQELKKFIKLNRPYITVTENTKGRVSGPTIIIHWKKALGAKKKGSFFKG